MGMKELPFRNGKHNRNNRNNRSNVGAIAFLYGRPFWHRSRYTRRHRSDHYSQPHRILLVFVPFVSASNNCVVRTLLGNNGQQYRLSGSGCPRCIRFRCMHHPPIEMDTSWE